MTESAVTPSDQGIKLQLGVVSSSSSQRLAADEVLRFMLVLEDHTCSWEPFPGAPLPRKPPQAQAHLWAPLASERTRWQAREAWEPPVHVGN